MAQSRILLTGANGFLGSHILKQLLPRPNVSVRTVVRSASKVDAVKTDFGQFQNLDFAIVPDITAPNAFHDALSKTDVPFDAVIHTASPFLYKAITDNREFIDPAVKGTTQILKDIKAVAPEVRRVVITSSFAAVAPLTQMESMRGHVYTEKDWFVLKL
jgi:nucleoside-diphosphate-sugar epimerase